LLSDVLDESAAEVWNAYAVGVFMPYQPAHRVPPRATLLPATIEELLADPSRTRGLVLEAVPELLTQVSARVASLKILEGTLLSLMLSERMEAKGLSHAASRLLGARELAELFGVPESWIREQARLGILPSFKLGHYVRFRLQEVERFLAERASQAA
jgi:excisionase family DNA binding protein